jgi:hypothetical protein
MTVKRVTLVVAIAAAMLDTPRSVRGAGEGDLSRRSAADVASAKGDWLQWGGAGRNFMPDATGLAASWPPAGRKSCGAARSAKATRRFSSRADASTRCTGRSACCRPCDGARRKWSPPSTPPAARRSGSSSTPRRPTASISHRALVPLDPAHCRQPDLRDEHPQGAVRARQGHRTASVGARLHEGVQRAVARSRLHLQSDSL